MSNRWPLVLVLILVLGGGAALAQEQAPADAPAAIPYGDQLYEVSAADGPVVAYVDAVIETEAGVEVRGTLVVRDDTGYRIAGQWVDPAPSRFADVVPGTVLVLAEPERLVTSR